MKAQWYGSLPYDKGLEIQKKLSFLALQDSQDHEIMGLTHPSCITLGHRADIASEATGDLNNTPVFKTDRGGEATAHEEGQLVIYPILNLKSLRIGAKDYVALLVSSTRVWLKELGISTLDRPHCPGVYTSKGKIASIGIRISQGVSRHGIAINVNNDLSTFNSIRVCGVPNADLSTIKMERGENLDLKEIFELWVRLFKSDLKNKLNKVPHDHFQKSPNLSEPL